MTAEPDYDSIIDEVTTTPGAIGYIGVGYAKGDLEIVPLRENSTSPAYLPNETKWNLSNTHWPDSSICIWPDSHLELSWTISSSSSTRWRGNP